MDVTALREISSATHGVFTPAMAKDAGFGKTAMHRLRADGQIRRVCGTGHIVGLGEPTIVQRAVAACLTWPEAIVCGLTAAIIHGLVSPNRDDGATHVLVPNGRRPGRGIATHYWSVRPTEVVRHDSWTVTDRRTTIADCLGRFADADAWGLFAWWVTRDQLTVADLETQLEDRYHLYGTARLRAMLSALRRGAVSPAEVELHEFLHEHGFTGWKGNQKIRVHGRIVANADVLFVREHVVIEFDGRLAHPDDGSAAARAKRRRDRARDRRLRELGYTVVRVRWEKLKSHPWDLRGEIAAALADASVHERSELA